ncbi:hypothetical protein [Microbacterium imperiale]|uniref:hypothetical protein n=1 Tax=Microbacterium imperiale TaxID=33884 RepID=UPI001FD95C8B|nr:hypothetical protein [Microbacterium imperiale]MBP2422205.1 hypothetical protein [Microbacterium imperiale]
MDQRILERLARDAGPLQSLSREEIGLDDEPVTIDPKPKPVRAWVRFGGTPVRVDGQACRWTSDAVAIRFLVGEVEHRTWVWASAVTPIVTTPR